MELTDWQINALYTLGGFLGGALLSLCAAYVSVIKDNSFIKGQLQNLLKIGDKLDDVTRSIVILDRNQVSLKKDVDAAHSRLRDIQKSS